MKRQLAWAAFLVCMPSAAWCQVGVPEALPEVANYPDPQCQKPQVDKINRPQTHLETGGFDAGAVGSYNARVKVFNKEAGAYNFCMHAYIDKANGDVKHIQEKANADLKQISDRANASMKAIQDKIRQAAADANSVATSMDAETAKLRRQ